LEKLTIGCLTGSNAKKVARITQEAGLLAVPVYATLNEIQDPFILVMGESGVSQLRDIGVIGKKDTITSLRGKAIKHQDVTYMVTYSPEYMDVEEDAQDQITWDLRLLLRVVHTNSTAPVYGEYAWHYDLSDFIDEIEERLKTEESVRVACDTETMGLYPWYPDKKIVTIQFSHEEGKATVVWLLNRPQEEIDDIIVQTRWLLTNPRIKLVGANWKYDAVWLAVKWGIECTNLAMDTTVVGSLLNENRSNSLKWHAKVYTDMGGYDDELSKTYDIGRVELVPKQVLLKYSGGDSDVTLRVANVMRPLLLKEKRLAQFYVKLLHPALKAFEHIERRGMMIDTKKLAELRADTTQKIEKWDEELFAMLPARLKNKHSEKIASQQKQGKSPLTSAILGDLMFSPHYGWGLKPMILTEKTQEPSTASEHLKMFVDHPEAGPFIEKYLSAENARKIRSTFIDGFLSHLRPDGMFHPTYMLFNGQIADGRNDDGGTNTGRLSAKDPAVQTIPKHVKKNQIPWAKLLRYCYIAPNGMVVFQVDFNQGELRITAVVAGEPTMIKLYREGKDLHVGLGATFAGTDYDTFLSWKKHTDEEKVALFDAYRQKAKSGNFGLIYGISAEGFVEYAWKSFGIKMTLKEAEETRDMFFSKMYPELLVWHRRYKKFAKENKYVVNPFGRVRHLPLIDSSNGFERSKAERQAVNSPIQSTLSDMCVWLITMIHEKYKGQVWVAGMTHDSVYGYLPEATAHQTLKEISDMALSLPYKKTFDWEPDIEFPIDAEIGPNLGALEKVKLA
jgi:DNA polymerase I-like protein with 3'-5' exonuclease and polymerase domains